MNGGSPDHLTLSEMLDALEERIDVLLHVHEDLAARLREAGETEDMNRKKSLDEGPGFGLLFPELGTEEAEELAEEAAKKKRVSRANKTAAPADSLPAPVVAPADATAPAVSHVDAVAEPRVEVAEATPLPVEAEPADAAVPWEVPEPAASAEVLVRSDPAPQADVAHAAETVIVPDSVEPEAAAYGDLPIEASAVVDEHPTPSQAPVMASEPEPGSDPGLPTEAPDPVEAQSAPVAVPDASQTPAMASEPEPTSDPGLPTEATEPVEAQSAPVAVPDASQTPAMASEPEPASDPGLPTEAPDPFEAQSAPVAVPDASQAPAMPEPTSDPGPPKEAPEPVEAQSALPAEPAPVAELPPPAATTAAAEEMPDWVTADDLASSESADTAEPWTPRPHPFLEVSVIPAIPATRTSPSVVPVPAPQSDPPQRLAEPVRPRPVLVPPPPVVPATRSRHPFAEFTSNAPRPVPVPAQKPSTRADSDVHWSFPAEQDINRRPDTLRMHMEKAGLNAEELAGALGVASAALNGWLSGSVPVPAWVLPSVAVLELVTPAARTAARGTVPPEVAPVRKTVSSQTAGRHPFARIEEL